MSDRQEPQVLRGILAGVAGGLAAAWVMNVFIEGPGQKLQRSLQDTQEESRRHGKPEQQAPKEDATMKAADAIVSTVTGGRHLSYEEKVRGGPVVHYGFGALVGGLYGGLAEYSRKIKTGCGTAFGSAVFTGADFLAVPGFNLSPPLSEQPKSLLATAYAAHIVYGATTELVRRLVRAIV